MIRCILFIILADILSVLFYRAVQCRWLLRVFVLSAAIEALGLLVIQEVITQRNPWLLMSVCLASGVGSILGMFVWKDKKDEQHREKNSVL